MDSTTIKTLETDILTRLRSGSKRERDAAIRQLYSLEWEGLARKAIQSVGGREADLEDVFQESLTALVKNVMYGKFKKISKLSTYFYEICRRRCMKDYQKKELISIEKITIEDTTPSLENLLIDKEKWAEKKALVNKLLDDIGEPCTSILKFRKLEYTYEEIAEEMDYGNSDTVKNQAVRCRKKMRKFIESDPDLCKKLKSL